MPMSTNQQNAYNAIAPQAGNLADKVTNYVNAQAALATAQSNADTAKLALDSAWSAFKTADGAFDGLMLAIPAGYTPPTT